MPVSARYGPSLAALVRAKLTQHAELLQIDMGKGYSASNYFAAPCRRGVRRWQAPESPAALQGMHDALAFSPSCDQPPLRSDSIYADKPESMSKDWLPLNIWVPENTVTAPVLVWPGG